MDCRKPSLSFTVAVGQFASDAVSRSGRLKGVTGFTVSASLPKPVRRFLRFTRITGT
jgi:hypothetical protein